MKANQAITKLEHLLCDRSTMWHDHSISSLLFGFTYSRCFALKLMYLFLQTLRTHKEFTTETTRHGISLDFADSQSCSWACQICFLRRLSTERSAGWKGCPTKEKAFAEIGSCTFEMSTSAGWYPMISFHLIVTSGDVEVCRAWICQIGEMPS